MTLTTRIGFCLTLLAAFIVGGMLVPSDAVCRLSAEAELNYVNYDVTDRNNQHLSANSLAQHYSLLYDQAGRLLGGRLGWYDMALGYEWTTFDTSIKSIAGSDNLGQSKGHVMFRGEVTLDPKEMPLQLHVYSRDLSRTSLITDSSTLYSSFASRTSSSNYQPGLITSLLDGQHINSGATLVMGVKNGMTNGYNELLRHFPMLMLDYRDEINKDLNSVYPVNNRLTRLAFVSLNKKDNWFHYRHTTYKDYVDSTSNYVETQIQLGTVDQTLQRRWIDFTNWLQISGDGQLTKRLELNGAEKTEEFSLNLFGVARRDKWEARTYNNFIRLKENDTLITYKTSVPVYASGVISPTAEWRAFANYNESKTNTGNYFTAVSSGYMVDAFRKSPFTLTQGLSVEHSTSSDGMQADMFTGNLGTNSTSMFSRPFSFGANYAARYYLYNNNTNSTFLDQELTGNAKYIASQNLLFSLTQTNRFTSGRSQAVSSFIGSGVGSSTQQYVDPRNGSLSSGGGYQSITALTTSWIPMPRLNATLLVSEDIFIPAGGESSTVTRVENSISYNSSNLSLLSRSTYSKGNSYSSGSNFYTNVSSQISTENTLSYIFNRNMDARVRMMYYKSLSGSGDQPANLTMEQAFNYYHYQAKGVARRLFEVNELFESYGDSTVNSVQRVNRFTLGAKYYPLRQIMLAAGTRYLFANRLSNYSLNYYGSIAVQFRLLEASLDYSYGKSSTDGRIEKKFTANVKKKF